jgi:O-antigen/teichoic acid export membrane protein
VSFEGIGDVMKFGLRMFGVGLSGSAAAMVNTLILGRILGGRAVGLYTMGNSLAEAPHRVSTAVINQVSMPVFARLQRELEPLRSSFLKISKYLAVVSLPLQVGMALVAPDVVSLFLSDKWEGVVPLLQIFALGNVVILPALTASPLLTALGRADVLLRVSAIGNAALAGALLIGAHFGLWEAALAWCLMQVPIRVWIVGRSVRELRLPLGAYFRNFASVITATAGMAGSVIGVRATLLPHGHGLEQLVVSVLVGAATYTVMLFALDRGFGPEIKAVAKDLLASARA